MDEVYYVPAAQTLLSGEKCAPYQDNCNLEHPFLSKAFIAAGIAVFGNDTFGWRIFNVILGTFSVPLLFGICWVITKNERLSIYAAFLLAFETLFFVHSSIAVIDVGAIFFGLLGFFFYFAKVRWWKLDNIALAGISLGLAALCKETAVFLFLVLVFYHLIFGQGTRRQIGVSTLLLCLWVFLVFAVGLETYDTLFGAGTATNFLGQIDFILKYGGGLVMTATSQGWIDSVLKTPITPLNWVTYYSPVGYLVTNVNVTSPSSSYHYIAVGYYGITNQFEVWLLYFWGAYTFYVWRKGKKVHPCERVRGHGLRGREARPPLGHLRLLRLRLPLPLRPGDLPLLLHRGRAGALHRGRLLLEQKVVPHPDSLHRPRGGLPLVLHLLPRQELPPDAAPRNPGPLSARVFTDVLIPNGMAKVFLHRRAPKSRNH